MNTIKAITAHYYSAEEQHILARFATRARRAARPGVTSLDHGVFQLLAVL
jgi:hypothetical protein